MTDDKETLDNSGVNEQRGGVVLTPQLIVIGIMLVLVAFGITRAVITQIAQPSANTESQSYRGTVIDPPKQLDDFTLTNVDGEAISLSDLSGRWVLLFFGYTYCPDVCPMTLGEYKRVFEGLEEQASEVAFVFISVDGERDTPDLLREYLEIRGVADIVIGLTGDEATVRAIGTQFGVHFEKVGDIESQAGYLVNHTSSSFLVDLSGQLRVLFSVDPETFSLHADMIVAQIKSLL